MIKNYLLNKEAGFSFIEVLVTLLIVSILAGIAIPNYTEIKGRVYDVTLKNDIRNMRTALSDLSANRDNDGYNYIITNGNIGFHYSYDAITNDLTLRLFNANLNFPRPFSVMHKSNGTRFYGAYEYTLNGTDYMYIYATHEKSKHRYYEYDNGESTFNYTFNNY